MEFVSQPLPRYQESVSSTPRSDQDPTVVPTYVHTQARSSRARRAIARIEASSVLDPASATHLAVSRESMQAVAPAPVAIPSNLATAPADIPNSQTRRGQAVSGESPRHQDAPMERPAPVKRRNLGEWILEKTIGAGSMGKVKLARHQTTGEQVKSHESFFIVNF